MKTVKTFVKKSDKTLDAEAYTTDGKVWRWTSNDRTCPLEACKDYGIPCDVEAQTQARKKEVDVAIAEYSFERKGRGHTPEEIAELRNAFGRGTTIVDAVSGEQITL